MSLDDHITPGMWEDYADSDPYDSGPEPADDDERKLDELTNEREWKRARQRFNEGLRTGSGGAMYMPDENDSDGWWDAILGGDK